ncbi:MAG: glycosyltransferase family 9 protein [Aquificae bacterium]|nr:glycosyltransferase family 9 protein [Aquificota bacterium]
MKRILVIRFSSLGDVALASSVLTPLYDGGYTIDFLTFKQFAPLFHKDYRVNRIISPEKEELKSIKDIIQFGKHLPEYDYILDIHSNLRSFILSSVVKGEVLRYQKNSLKRRLYTKKLFRSFLKDSFNVVEAYTKPLKSIGISVESPRPYIPVHQDEIQRVKGLLPENFITIGAGARYKNKAYPYFPQVSKILLEKGYNVVLLGSEGDKKLDKGNYPRQVVDLRGKLPLRDSLAVLKLSKLTISNDSAVAHMSRSVKTPVLMVYGATSPYFGFAPFKDEGDYIYLGLDCQPCNLHGKKECMLKSLKCLDIPPQMVVEKGLKLLER